MEVFAQQIINGLILGSVYSLVALGYTMVYGILQLINFAHGEVLMFGAMVSLTVISFLQIFFPGMPGEYLLIFALFTAVPVCAILAATIERVAYRPLRKAPRLAPLITAIGISIILQTIAMIIWSPNPRVFPDLLNIETIEIFGAFISPKQILIIITAAFSMILLMFFVMKTNFGRAMRAVSENPEMASLMGISVNKIITMTFMIGASLAAIAGILVALNYNYVHFTMGFILGLKAFTAAVLGGIGNLAGAVLGGLLLGLIESLGAGYMGTLTGGFLGSHYQDVLSFGVLILVLIIRPSGILGERVADRA
ncbi:MAG: branched-chain amino acid ABC transporter permease [Betaproteobacteria bacterium TMED156]|nr:MAG: branched-chain amino acid ABC transporter permease [Betaproteobacteria bacterium TMED156]|tara:strand:- start:32 stop:961 length:930 start_codon:yes stop_codon:yes gene_type:complete